MQTKMMPTHGQEGGDLGTALDACRQTTRSFPAVYGLRLVPFGVWFLAVPMLGPFDLTFALLAPLAAALLATAWIDRWYRLRFGRVEPGRLRLGRGGALLAGALAAGLAFAAAGAALLPRSTGFVGTLVVVLFAAAVLFGWPRSLPGAATPAAVGLAGFVALAALLLLAVSRDAARFALTGDLFSVLLGAFLALAGVVEHGALCRALASEPADGD